MDKYYRKKRYKQERFKIKLGTKTIKKEEHLAEVKCFS